MSLLIVDVRLTALHHWTRGSGFPAYDVSKTTLAPSSTVVSQGPQSMVAGDWSRAFASSSRHSAAISGGKPLPVNITDRAHRSHATCVIVIRRADRFRDVFQTINLFMFKNDALYSNDLKPKSYRFSFRSDTLWMKYNFGKLVDSYDVQGDRFYHEPGSHIHKNINSFCYVCIFFFLESGFPHFILYPLGDDLSETSNVYTI